MHYSSPLHLIKLRFGHIKRSARRRCRLCRRRLGQRLWAWCEKSGLTQNVIDKQACASAKPAKCSCPTGRASNKLRALFTPCILSFFSGVKIQSRCSTSNSRWPEKTERLWLYLLLQRLKNFALISASDSETSRRSPEVDRQ